MKFKVGDIVRGNKEADFIYGITTSYCTGEVVKVYDDGTILLKIISHKRYKNEIGHEFDVDGRYFDLVVTDNWTGLYGVANRKQLFIVENGVPVVENVSKDSSCYKQLCSEYEKYLKNEKEKNENALS